MFCLAAAGIAFTGCLSVTPERISKGKNFGLDEKGRDQYDSTKPMSEQSALIHLGQPFTILITGIDGKEYITGNTEIVILKPGRHIVECTYEDTIGRFIRERFDFNAEPGAYYYFKGQRSGDSIEYELVNLDDVDRVHVYTSVRSGEYMPVEAVKAGMDFALPD